MKCQYTNNKPTRVGSKITYDRTRCDRLATYKDCHDRLYCDKHKSILQRSGMIFRKI